MTDTHEPTPDFLRFLEWQVTTELRRRERFDGATTTTPRSGRWFRTLRAAAMITVSLLAGAGVVIASEGIGEARQAKILQERNRTRIEVAERRVELAREELDRAGALVENGFASSSSLARSEAQFARVQGGLLHLQLVRDELAAGSVEPSSAETLTAPLVGGRDFVTEHLQVDLDLAQKDFEAARAEAQRTRLLVESGMAPTAELHEVEAVAEARRIDLDGLLARMTLRKAFLKGGLDPAEVERRTWLAKARHDLAVARAEIERLGRALELAHRYEAAGLESGRSASLEVELEAARADARIAELEIELFGGTR